MNVEHDDIRWLQRFDNYKKALEQLNDAIEVMNERSLSNLEKQGLVQAFEFTHELSWKVLKDFLEYRGATDLYGSRDVVRRAFSLGILEEGEIWMNMIKSRNLTSHTYNEDVVDEIIGVVHSQYVKEFNKLAETLVNLENTELD
jgi:nucleotidyltransferase substrate binding protein (TIGR01987 family)